MIDSSPIAPYPGVSFSVSISGLSAGHYTGVLPVALSWASYHGNEGDYVEFSDDLAFQYKTEGSIPYDINITAACSILPSNIDFSYGTLAADIADGNIKTKDLLIACDAPASANLSIQSANAPSVPYVDGFGVGLGHDWDAVLKFGNTGISNVSSNKSISVYNGTTTISIESKLKKIVVQSQVL